MHTIAAAGTGFLLAVLWFDLMFDMQTRGHAGVLPESVLKSISGYYRRVTTEAFPMNRLVAVAMLVVIGAIIGEIVQGRLPWWISWGSLILTAPGTVYTLSRTVPNAVRLGSAVDDAAGQSALARAIYGDHVFAFARMTIVLGLQIAAQWVG
jgi:hypothetical protein